LTMNIEEIPDYKLGETPENLPDENPILYRLINAKRALRAGYEDVEDTGACITDMLADLRHLCDACGIEFYTYDRVAYNHYTAEKHDDGKDNVEEEIQTRTEEEFEKKNESKAEEKNSVLGIVGGRRTLTKEDWIEIYYALEAKVNYRIDNAREYEDDGNEWLNQLRDIMTEVGPDGCNYWPERTCCAVVGASKHDPENSRTFTPPQARDAEGHLIDPALSTWICPICSEKVYQISFRHIAECGTPYCSECDADMNLYLP